MHSPHCIALPASVGPAVPDAFHNPVALATSGVNLAWQRYWLEVACFWRQKLFGVANEETAQQDYPDAEPKMKSP